MMFSYPVSHFLYSHFSVCSFGQNPKIREYSLSPLLDKRSVWCERTCNADFFGRAEQRRRKSRGNWPLTGKNSDGNQQTYR